MLAETFGRPEGFTFSMAVPDLPFTPISPASASIFLFPTAKSNTALTPSQRRCSTPYSLRPLRSLGKQQEQGPIPPQPILTEVEDFAMETDTSKPVETESDVKPETENKPETTENERTPVPQEEVAMETEDTAKAETDVQGEAVTGEPVERKPSESTDASPVQEKDLQYFKNLVSSETTRLLDRCSIWETIMSDNKLSEEVLGEIRSSIGKAKLLIDQRFKQFLGLVKNCEFGLGEKVTHCSDLEGFWEMIYFQVEDVDTLFKELEKLQANNWQREEKKVDKPKIIKKKKPVTKKLVGGEAAAKRIAARERLLAAKAAMQAKATRKAESEKVVFEGGFFKVESPARKATPAKTKELREDGLSRQALQNRTNIMASPASNLRSPALLKRTNIMASPASTLCSPALKKMTIMASPGSNLCSPALQSKRTKMMESPLTNLCSPIRRKTRKSSMGFGLSKAASLFTPEKDTPEKGAPVQDLISWN
ncbi:disks large-associated protein 5 [Strongylocentrotus purpuratus]|uniref:Disks large-associated protein 5 n=1 Tax=Strongylocentrotus purpuratus TaxID=7668 RepID=A0A7M7N259_STRPU|nr:disks large-associated protein 5 [Strongylocentrotus purpuratus]